MIKVYFESRTHSELIATFENEEAYNMCTALLEKLAENKNMILTESFENKTETA